VGRLTGFVRPHDNDIDNRLVLLGSAISCFCVADGDLRENRTGRRRLRFATLIRTFVIILILAGFVFFTGKWANPLSLSPKTWIFLALSGLATGASWVCYFRALKVGDASKVAPVDKLSLVLVAIFAVIFLHERPSAREWIGILMVGLGAIVLGFKR
jgi:transporter family protein